MGCQRQMEITRCGTCSTLSLFFHIDIAQSTPGEHLHVVGSHEGLGAWDPEKGARLTTNERTYPVWRSRQVELRCAPEDSSTVLVLKYKYVLDRRELKQGFLWEENIPDREVQIPWSQDCDCVWLIRDSAFNREAATKVTKLAPGAKLLRSPQQEASEGLISAPEETPEAEEPTATPLFDAKPLPEELGSASAGQLCQGVEVSPKRSWLPEELGNVRGFRGCGTADPGHDEVTGVALCNVQAQSQCSNVSLARGLEQFGLLEESFSAEAGTYMEQGDFAGIALLCPSPIKMKQLLGQVVRIESALLIVQCGDDPNVPREQEPFPVFHSEGGEGVWNIPWLNPYHLRALANGLLDDRLAPERVPWAEKKRVVYWRGALTSPDDIPPSEAHRLPRFRVFKLASLRPELYDVGISNVDNVLFEAWGMQVVRKIAKRHGVRLTPYEDFNSVAPAYRYLLNLNGVVSSWRLASLLRTGSALLLQSSETHEALHWELVAWKHYAPVSSGLDDLMEVVATLESNETLAKNIAQAGADFYKQRMRPEDTYCLVLRTLEVSQVPEVTLQDLVSRGFVPAPGKTESEPISTYLVEVAQISPESAPTLRERLEGSWTCQPCTVRSGSSATWCGVLMESQTESGIAERGAAESGAAEPGLRLHVLTYDLCIHTMPSLSIGLLPRLQAKDWSRRDMRQFPLFIFAVAGQFRLMKENIVELIDARRDVLLTSLAGMLLPSHYDSTFEGGDLLEVMQGPYGLSTPHPATALAKIFTIAALEQSLHQMCVVHRDVKCENVFKVEAPNTVALEDCTYKLGDFGLAACVMPDEVLMDQVGSPSTSAPEVVRGRPYGKPADMWSAGAAIYTLLAGRRPFEAGSSAFLSENDNHV
ncbi:CPK2 [Symbiodinium pilosum]|uniref:CPK2 protein n=1 Tax=Symbiodinium pilosum TaxID=2952 RepID=A0A812IQH2_SYMPI|nr:CPK2 [Symbiodinium pilosum]